MRIINLTPHTINILRAGLAGPEPVLNIPPSGNVARLEVERKEVDIISFANGENLLGDDGHRGISLYESIFGEPTDLPPQKKGVIYIVPSLFRSGFDRDDLWGAGELIRDSIGKPIGCLGLSR